MLCSVCVRVSECHPLIKDESYSIRLVDRTHLLFVIVSIVGGASNIFSCWDEIRLLIFVVKELCLLSPIKP